MLAKCCVPWTAAAQYQQQGGGQGCGGRQGKRDPASLTLMNVAAEEHRTICPHHRIASTRCMACSAQEHWRQIIQADASHTHNNIRCASRAVNRRGKLLGPHSRTMTQIVALAPRAIGSPPTPCGLGQLKAWGSYLYSLEIEPVPSLLSPVLRNLSLVCSFFSATRGLRPDPELPELAIHHVGRKESSR